MEQDEKQLTEEVNSETPGTENGLDNNHEEIVEEFETPLNRSVKKAIKVPPKDDTKEKEEMPPKDVGNKNKASWKYDKQFITEIKPEELEEFEKMPLTEELRAKYIQTYNDMQKYNRLQNERLNKIKEYEKLLGEDGKKIQNFIETFREDPIAALTRYSEEYGLPDVDGLLSHLQRAKDTFGEIEIYQKKELIPKLEKKYALDEGTFIYDPAEAYTPNTPSYEYRVMTERKEMELKEKIFEEQKKSEQLQSVLAEERKKQLSELKNMFFPEIEISEKTSEKEKKEIAEKNVKTEEEFVALLSGLDDMFMKMKETQSFSPDANPLSLINIFRGVHFNKLVERIVEQEVNKVHQQYHSKGLYLPDEETKPMPKDITKVVGKSPIPEKTTGFQSPLQRMILRTIKEKGV
ncbi:hypothetical protein [Ignavibacterium sp.]|uniref:hypothetical protein n=1 Tax=Ignavibacterium sp. TaxID=2651167 RepID=UPI00307CD43E